ncbi:hypothetical protein SKAU_G00327280 [Synaphobranchus kaupii]|uniref:Uncharacterized protein n=1 Tax=Synaphobranchus kaupii TaxID=118154 RepID=A0A9Q1EPT9_SYNKA|nr:hypothetical protein SKAU_G00327280 [Synaphobranchus kaupii]
MDTRWLEMECSTLHRTDWITQHSTVTGYREITPAKEARNYKVAMGYEKERLPHLLHSLSLIG